MINDITSDLTYIIKLVKEKSGIVFTLEKSYMLLDKLKLIVAKYNLENVHNLSNILRQTNNQSIALEVVEALTINETSFYRDTYPFEALHNYVIPHLLEYRPEKKVIKILSAACSTGQEPYSIAMHFLEHKEYNLNCSIMALDLSNQAIEKAKSGLYNSFEVQRGLSPSLLIKYFSEVDKGWLIEDKVREQVTFKAFNLMNDLSGLGLFDVVFCRNVLLYFDDNTRKKVLDNLKKVMNKDSVLILGGADSISFSEHEFKKVSKYNSVYNFYG